MSSVSLCLTYCTRGFQTSLVLAGRCHDIGRVEFRQGNIIFYWIVYVCYFQMAVYLNISIEFLSCHIFYDTRPRLIYAVSSLGFLSCHILYDPRPRFTQSRPYIRFLSCHIFYDTRPRLIYTVSSLGFLSCHILYDTRPWFTQCHP